MSASTESDAWGIPVALFGDHQEDFYSGLGRLAALSGLLECNIRVLANKLYIRSESKHSAEGFKRVLLGALKGADAVKLPEHKDQVEKFLRSALHFAERRNFYIHSIWPAQPDNSLFAWKCEPWNTTESLQLDKLRTDIGEFVALASEWQRVWPIVSGLPDPVVEKKP